MRCKNCGSENNDNLYICQNCGSPLYDENEPVTAQSDSTRMFTTVPPAENGYSVNGYNEVNPQRPYSPNTDTYIEKQKEEKKKKNQIIVIVILAIILVAIIVGIVAAYAHSRNKPDNDPDTSVSSLFEALEDESTSEDALTSQESTQEETTEKTTTTTTTTTTTEKAKTYTVNVDTLDSGWAEGGGIYEKGKQVTVYCGADDGYVFDGWYQNGKRVSSSETYTFTVTGNTNLVAKFKQKATEPQTKNDSEDGEQRDDSQDWD